jgi:hypothetical protein
MTYQARLSPTEMVLAREEQLREEGRAQERARLLALLHRTDIVRIRDGQVNLPDAIVNWRPAPDFIQEWDGVR